MFLHHNKAPEGYWKKLRPGKQPLHLKMQWVCWTICCYCPSFNYCCPSTSRGLGIKSWKLHLPHHAEPPNSTNQWTVSASEELLRLLFLFGQATRLVRLPFMKLIHVATLSCVIQRFLANPRLLETKSWTKATDGSTQNKPLEGNLITHQSV